MLNIAILTESENGSPKVLAKTLEQLLIKCNSNPVIFYQVKALKRLLSYKIVKYNRIAWYLYKIKNYIKDKNLFLNLKKMDAVIICGCTPNAFYKDTYNIKKFKRIINNKPVLYYAVQYLGNAPTIIEKLTSGNHSLLERFDWHLSVSDVTEIRQKPGTPWSQIGLFLKSTGLKPVKKDKFFAVVDFKQPGHEKYREMQIKILEELNIPYISFESRYSIDEIRSYYRKASVYFIQSTEAYGLPIAECLASGSYIMIADSSWPMSWRLDEKPEVHGPGTLPECFVVYNDEEHLKKQLITIRDTYDLEETPKNVFNIFYKHYPSFYDGNEEGLKEVLKRIEDNCFN